MILGQIAVCTHEVLMLGGAGFIEVDHSCMDTWK